MARSRRDRVPSDQFLRPRVSCCRGGHVRGVSSEWCEAFSVRDALLCEVEIEICILNKSRLEPWLHRVDVTRALAASRSGIDREDWDRDTSLGCITWPRSWTEDHRLGDSLATSSAGHLSAAGQLVEADPGLTHPSGRGPARRAKARTDRATTSSCCQPRDGGSVQFALLRSEADHH